MAEAGHNGFEPETVKGFVARIERLHKDIASEKGSYAQAIGVIRGDIKEIFDEAKDAGIPKKELKAVIKTRALEARVAAARDDLEAEQQDTYDNIRLALGDLADTPLGEAATAGKA